MRTHGSQAEGIQEKSDSSQLKRRANNQNESIGREDKKKKKKNTINNRHALNQFEHTHVSRTEADLGRELTVGHCGEP